MPTAMPIITDLTDSDVTEGEYKTKLTDFFSSIRENGDPLCSYGKIQNLSLVFSVSASALTCAVKQRDGSTNADAINVIAVPFRHATASNGSFNVRNIAGALSLTISSGSTLGHISAIASPIYWYLIDNAGTVELAASTKFFGIAGIVSTTAEGGAGAADSNIVMYSATSRSNVPYVCVGRTTDTQSTAGTWAAAPSIVDLSPFHIPPFSHGSDVASSSTINLNAVNGRVFDITGTTGISTITLEDGGFCVARFTGAVTLTHGSNLVLNNNGSNITTAAGDFAFIFGYGSSVVRALVMRADGQPISGNSSGSGSPVQAPVRVIKTSYTLYNGTHTFITDNTSPTTGETEAVMGPSSSFTCQSTSNFLKIDVMVNLDSASSGDSVGICIFRDSDSTAFKTWRIRHNANSNCIGYFFSLVIPVPDTSAHTYTLRIGNGNGNNFIINGDDSGALFNGGMVSYMEISELAA